MKTRYLTNPVNLQMFFLFLSSFVVLFVGMGLFPLLPVYAARFGATPTIVGIYFALTYLANMAGSMIVGGLATRMNQRRLFIMASLLGLPALVLLGRVTALWQIIVLTSLAWFSGGLLISLVNIFTALFAAGNRRGRTFSLISLTMPLGSLVGGMVAGQVIGWKGFEMLFIVMGAAWLALPLIGLFGLKDPRGALSKSFNANVVRPEPKLGSSYLLLLLLYWVSTTAINASRFGTSLSMQHLDFTASAIASSATLSGLVALPFTYLIGVLSDRLERRRFLMLIYVLVAVGALTQVVATQLWHFWLAAILLMVSLTANTAVTPALVTDILPTPLLNRGLSRLRIAYSAAGILSFASAGYLIDAYGLGTLYLVAILLSVVSATLLSFHSTRPRWITWLRLARTKHHLPRLEEHAIDEQSTSTAFQNHTPPVAC